MTPTQHQRAVNRLASRHLASKGGLAFTQDVQKALGLLHDAIDIAESRSSDNPETGEALTDWSTDSQQAVDLIRAFSAKIEPLLRRIH